MPMLPTLRSLLEQRELALRLLTPEHAVPAGSLDAPIEWVHSSDLADPTPFLSAGQVLLSTGTQFEARPGGESDDAAAPVDSYVRRLRDAGVAGLGFGTEVVRAGTPDELVAACLEHGLPLFEVPYRTPFIALARTAADMAAEERFARRSWSLGAQRAIAIAALRPDGLSASLEELSRQLDHWVALFNANGVLERVYPAGAFAAASAAVDGNGEPAAPPVNAVQREAARLLRGGRRASLSVVAGGDTLTLHTLGRHGRLRGVLALGGRSELDQASKEVITAVIALAGLALEQSNALERARGRMRAAVLQAMRHGGLELARAVSAEMWGGLPAEPVRWAVLDPGELRDVVVESLQAHEQQSPGALFFAAEEGRIVLCLGEWGVPVLEELCAAFSLRAGLSEPGGHRELDRGLAQAERAAWHGLDAAGRDRTGAAPSPGVVAFGALAEEGVLAYLGTTGAGPIGAAVLRPLAEHDREHGAALVQTLRLWLEQNGQFDATAQLLGVHRHTVRARIIQAEKLLGCDLGGFRQRAELWAALLVAGDGGAEGAAGAAPAGTPAPPRRLP